MKRDFLDLKREHKTLVKALKVKRAQIDVERKKCEDVQLLKFGQVLWLPVLKCRPLFLNVVMSLSCIGLSKIRKKTIRLHAHCKFCIKKKLIDLEMLERAGSTQTASELRTTLKRFF